MALTKMRRTLAPISLIAAVGLALAGCGDGGESENGETPDDNGGSESEEPNSDAGGGEDFSGVTLEVSGAWSGAERENFEMVLANVEDDTGARINYTSHGDKAATTLGTQIEGGSPPDVALLSQPALLKQLETQGDLVPLSDAAKDLVSENYAESWVDLATDEDAKYDQWFNAFNNSTMYQQ